DDTDGLVSALNNLGIVYKNLRDWREATRFLEQALKLDEREGLFSRMRAHHQNLGLIRYRLGQWDLAEEDFRQSLRIARETGHQHLEQNDEAEEHLARGAALAEQLGDRVERALAERARGRLDAVRGDADAMGAKLRAAAQCFDELGETYELAVSLSAQGEYLFLLPASTRVRLPLES